jgi:integrase
MKNPRTITVRSLEAFNAKGRRLHCGTRGLFLAVTRSGTKLFIYRYVSPITHRTTETSVGEYPKITLADARAQVGKLEREIILGNDPIQQKRMQRAEAKARSQAATFKTALASYVEAHKKRAGIVDLKLTLERHAQGLMNMSLQTIDPKAVAAALKKVHASAAVTARKTLAMVARVLDHARVMGELAPTTPNAAQWRGGFEHLWPARPATTHFRALDYREVPELYARLCQLDTSAAFCLRFAILTGVRTSNALYATFDQIDMSTRTWAIPPAQMKVRGRDPFVVPLGEECMGIIEAMRQRHGGDGLVFRSDQHRGRMHPRTLFYVLTKVLGVDFTVHGFRSSLRDFLGDRTSTERDVAEMCLAHFASGVEAAYGRSTALQKRAVALDLWASHVIGASAADNVVTLKAAR